MTKQVRWKCEKCDDGLLAPTRPRKNDVRRYCLPCSAKQGTLVERIAPALQKHREKRAAFVSVKVKEKRVREQQKLQPIKERQKKARQRQAIFEKEADRIWSLFYPEGTWRKRPRIKIVFARNRGCSGVNYGGSNILIRIGRTSSGGVSEWEVLAHELCHSVVPTSLKNGSHGKAFYVALKNVIEARWKVRMDWSSINGYTTSSHSWGYKVDWLMRAQLEKANVVKFSYPDEELLPKRKKVDKPKPTTYPNPVPLYIPRELIDDFSYPFVEHFVEDDNDDETVGDKEIKKKLYEIFSNVKPLTKKNRGAIIEAPHDCLKSIYDEGNYYQGLGDFDTNDSFYKKCERFLKNLNEIMLTLELTNARRIS